MAMLKFFGKRGIGRVWSPKQYMPLPFHSASWRDALGLVAWFHTNKTLASLRDQQLCVVVRSVLQC